ncbi:MAG: Gfo/Idh/MocA family oxidoreductase [Chloroflexi bacterium]|nr:Gfo/Idh/MocA family oxidoreductase [Chloroflexota bacterium]
MAVSKLRVGVIGVGRMGERHCRVYANMPFVDLVGISDRFAERGRAVAATYGVDFYPDHGDLLDRVEAVSVVTPTDTHFAIGAECVHRGVHVLIEKPLARTLAEARKLATLAEHSTTLVQVGHIERFNPAFLEFQAIVQDLDVVGLAAHRLSPFDTSGTDADVVYDLMIHDIDLALTLLPREVGNVQATGRAARTTGLDYAVATLSMDDGPIATLTASRITEQKVRLLEVTTLGAYVTADLLNKSIRVYRRAIPEFMSGQERPLRYRQENLVEWIHIPTAEPLMLELQDFVRCIRDGDRPKVAATEGLRALTLASAIVDQIYAPACDSPTRRREPNAAVTASAQLAAV